MTGIQQQLSQSDQRVLHKEAQGVLQFVSHHSHQPVHLGYLVHLPGSFIDIVQASHMGSYVGTDDVAQREHPRLPKKQAYLEKDEMIRGYGMCSDYKRIKLVKVDAVEMVFSHTIPECRFETG